MQVIFASRSKAKAKPQRRDFASSSTRTIPIGERTWTDVEPGKYSLNDYLSCVEETDPSCSSWKSTSRQWWSDWILEIKKIIFRIILCFVIIGLTKSGRAPWHEEEDTRKDVSIVLTLQEQSCTSELFKAIQDGVSLILLYKTMSFFRTVSSSTSIMSDVQSIYIPSSIQDWYRRTKFWATDRQYFLLVDPMDKEHKDPDTIDLGAPRLAQYMHKVWKKHQNTVYWVDINLALKKGLKFHQTRSNAIILHETLPAYCIPKVVRMETGEVIFEKVYLSPRPPPKISLKHDWMKELGSEVARQPEGEVARQAKKFPIIPTKPKSKSWSKGETRCLLRGSVPFSGNRYTFLSWKQELNFRRRCKSR